MSFEWAADGRVRVITPTAVPDRAFKFLHSRDQELMLSGSIRLGSLKSYRELEGRKGGHDLSDGRGDSHENAEVFKGSFASDRLSVEHSNTLRVRGVYVSPGTRVRMDDFTSSNAGRDCFALCLSSSMTAWSADIRRQQRYDAVVEVRDLPLLAAKLALLHGFDYPPAVGRVSYDAKTKGLLEEAEGATPWRKRRRFQPEREIRILLSKALDDKRSHIDLADPELREHLRFRKAPPP